MPYLPLHAVSYSRTARTNDELCYIFEKFGYLVVYFVQALNATGRFVF